MSSDQPPAITLTERARRIDLVRHSAAKLGFRGRVEYWHRYGSEGPAQVRLGANITQDVLRVFSQVFERENDPQQFSLEAIVAHECGHQVFHRHRLLHRWFGSRVSLSHEEIIASLIAALLVASRTDKDALLDKAFSDALETGISGPEATSMINGLRAVLELLLC